MEESVYIVIIVLLAAICAVLLMRLLSLRAALREMVQSLDDKLQSDTNTVLSISSGDRTIRAIAAQWNRHLRVLRREQLRLRCGDRELKDAVTGISHDLRTPLAAICGYLELLSREPLSEKAERYLAILRERTETMRGLTEELFRYSVILDTEETCTAQPVCVQDILEQSLAGLYGTLSMRGMVPEIVMPEEPVVRMLDAGILRRIFDNILSNAAKYSDGDLSVRLTPDGTVYFENSAKSLDTVQTARLFDRFFTVQTARDGTGLGLSIAKQLTEKAGGTISATYRAGCLSIRAAFPAETEAKTAGVYRCGG